MARDLNIKVTVDSAQAEAALGRVDKSIGGVEKSAQGADKATAGFQVSMGKVVAAAGGYAAVSAGISNMVGFARESVVAIGEQEAALSRLATALETQGTLTPQTIAQYAALAAQFQNTTKFSDDLTIEMEALLVQVGNVLPAQMEAALQASMNLSAGLGMDLPAATMLVAKAFASGGDQLGRLKSLLGETAPKGEDMAAVLDAINAKFGGQAVAQLDTYNGKIAVLSNKWNDFQEKVGGMIATVATPLLDWFLKMPEAIQLVVFGVSALIGVLAPLAGGVALVAHAFGVSLLPIITGTLLPLLAPAGALIAGIIAVWLAWKNWDKIVALVQLVYGAVKEWLVDKFTAIVGWISDKALAIVAVFLELKDKIVAFITNHLVPILIVTGPLGLAIAGIVTLWKKWDQIPIIAKQVYEGVKTWLVDKFAAVVNYIGEKVGMVTGFFRDMYDKVVGRSYVPDMITAIGQSFAQLPAVMVEPTRLSTTAVTGLFRDASHSIAGAFSQTLPTLNSMFTNMINGNGGVAQSVRSLATNATQALTSMIPVIGPFISQFSGAIVAGMEKLGKKIGGFFKNLFGGPDKDELAGRELVAAFEKNLAEMLTETQRMEAGNDAWKMTIIAIRDQYLAMGLSEADALRDAERLWASSKLGAEATQRVIEDIQRRFGAGITVPVTVSVAGVPDLPTMHAGGVVDWPRAHRGLAIDEVPIVALRGEGVLNRSAMARIGGASGLNALNRGAAGAGATSVQLVGGRVELDGRVVGRVFLEKAEEARQNLRLAW